jgi:hypothetical protein
MQMPSVLDGVCRPSLEEFGDVRPALSMFTDLLEEQLVLRGGPRRLPDRRAQVRAVALLALARAAPGKAVGDEGSGILSELADELDKARVLV